MLSLVAIYIIYKFSTDKCFVHCSELMTPPRVLVTVLDTFILNPVLIVHKNFTWYRRERNQLLQHHKSHHSFSLRSFTTRDYLMKPLRMKPHKDFISVIHSLYHTGSQKQDYYEFFRDRLHT